MCSVQPGLSWSAEGAAGGFTSLSGAGWGDGESLTSSSGLSWSAEGATGGFKKRKKSLLKKATSSMGSSEHGDLAVVLGSKQSGTVLGGEDLSKKKHIIRAESFKTYDKSKQPTGTTFPGVSKSLLRLRRTSWKFSLSALKAGVQLGTPKGVLLMKTYCGELEVRIALVAGVPQTRHLSLLVASLLAASLLAARLLFTPYRFLFVLMDVEHDVRSPNFSHPLDHGLNLRSGRIGLARALVYAVQAPPAAVKISSHRIGPKMAPHASVWIHIRYDNHDRLG